MILSQRVQDIARALYERHLDLARGDDEARRQLARYIAEQARFELGGSWGHKRADPGRPPSKDAIAQQQPDGKLFAWDLFNGDTRKPNVNPESIDITGQTFIDVSPGTNYLGDPPPPPPPPPQDDDAVRVALRHIGEQLEAQARLLADVGADVAKLLRVPDPTYAGTASGANPLPFGPRTISLEVMLVPKVTP